VGPPSGRPAGSRYHRPVTPSATAPLVHARDLVKRFGDFTAVDSVSFDVAAGESFGFLGPNGAGKSSTMRMIGCVSPPTSGALRILGRDPATDGPRIRAELGVVPQQDSLDMELTVEENLIVYARYFDLPYREARARARELLDFVQLTDRARDEVEPLSGGMKRRLTIARGLVNRPRLLLLDEPTTGLDPRSRLEVQSFVEELRDDHDVTVVLTTHDLAEADRLCDRIGILDRGKLVAEGTPEELRAQVATERGLPPTMESVFMGYTGRSLDDDVEEEDPDAEGDGR